MRSLMMATLAMATLAATPAIAASYETGYLGQALMATGIITRDVAPLGCRATASEWEDGLAIVMESGGRFKDATLIGSDDGNWVCIN